MKKKKYQIQIVLRDSKPKIWRRILIPSDLLLSDFHKIIQTTMGWTNPQKVIALDKLFKGNDQLKTNTSLQMKDTDIEFKTI